MPARPLPIVGIPACLRTINERVVHTVADKYPSAIIEATGCLPVSIPAVGAKIDVTAVLDMLDGLLLTGSPSNVHPSEYGCEPLDAEIMHDLARDATTLPLIREAVRRDLPVLAICRGIQELNVALGGSLHQRLHEMPDRISHRPRKGAPEGPYGPAHSVALTPGGLLAALVGGEEIMVNSLHSQGIDRPAPGLRVEAVAPDGQIEAVSLPQASFVVGVQWHPEYRVLENPVSAALFAAFGRACRAALAGPPAAVRAA
ncbi:MAG TPA: gamma-glutamyl-gamma-aminobutyrate hydrolase family protein [Stellaceae bacterium]|jgi:putative glutamine amidotransferase|nr:gamma-glutamyl-gamma-aminobutyrate hydrolase family protein [Stellaceae bacterium]